LLEIATDVKAWDDGMAYVTFFDSGGDPNTEIHILEETLVLPLSIASVE
jgi:hypothetical protein